jgi:hypothetical protein
MCRNNPYTVHEVKEETEAADIRITPDTLVRAVANSKHWLQIMLDAGGSHIEHVFHWHFPKSTVLMNTKITPVHHVFKKHT